MRLPRPVFHYVKVAGTETLLLSRIHLTYHIISRRSLKIFSLVIKTQFKTGKQAVVIGGGYIGLDLKNCVIRITSSLCYKCYTRLRKLG